MENAYLLELLKTLDEDERNELTLFVGSAYFNRGKFAASAPELLRMILDAGPDFSKVFPEKRVVYERLFPGQAFVEGKLEKVMAELNKLVRTFLQLVHYQREENVFQQNFDLAVILRQRGLTGRYKQVVARLEKHQEQIARQSDRFFYHQLLLETEKHEWQNTFNQNKGDVNLSKAVESLDMFAFTHRIELLNRFLLQQKVANLDTPASIQLALEESRPPARYFDGNVVLQINYKIFSLLRQQEPTPTAFQELVDLLNVHEKTIEPGLLKHFYTYARNFCVLLINSGVDELAPMLHHLQKDNLARGYLYYEGKLSPTAYMSVTAAAIRVKKYDWALEFIEKHKGRIIGDNETHDFYRLNRAVCLFALGRFEEALATMPETSPSVGYLLILRRLELKILYETRSDLLPYKIDAFKMFLSRASNKFLARALREYQNNFVNFLYQLTHSIPGDKKRSERLVRRISARKFVSEREWLLDKARQLA
ncbi:MAG: hypothetical protein U0U46_16485 [Saprospiraceae bacterium]